MNCNTGGWVDRAAPRKFARQGRSNRQSEGEKGQKPAGSRRRAAEAVEGRVHSVEAARLLLIAWVVRGEMSYPHFRPFSSRTAVTRGQRRGRSLERSRGKGAKKRDGSPITGMLWVTNKRGGSTPVFDFTHECRHNHFALKLTFTPMLFEKFIPRIFYVNSLLCLLLFFLLFSKTDESY